MNTNDSGDDILIIAYGENSLEENDPRLSDINVSKDPGFLNLSALIKHQNDYYKNPNKSNNDPIATTTKLTEAIFDLERIKNEAKTRWVVIVKNVNEDYYKSDIINPKTVSTSYNLLSNDITCQNISQDYILDEDVYKHYSATYPNHIIKDYYSKKYGNWCRELDNINAPESGNKIFLLTDKK